VHVLVSHVARSITLQGQGGVAAVGLRRRPSFGGREIALPTTGQFILPCEGL
jgi:hypothetical protein